MKVRAYSDADAAIWDETVGRSDCGNFLHTRRFLSYHGGRFADRSLLCEDDAGRLAGVFPAAIKAGEPGCVVSHPGATYGGLVHGGEAGPGDIGGMLDAVIEHYRAAGLRHLEYKSVPPHLHAVWAQADVHAIWARRAQLVQRDLWNVLDLRDGRDYTKHHERAVGRARKSGLTVCVADSAAAYRDFHAVLAANLEERHEAAPVHTAAEMLELKERFPRDIALWLAQDAAGRIAAGCWVFMFGKRAWHTQYIAATAEGRDWSATHLVFDGLIDGAQKSGIACLSFGRSTEGDGRRLNAGLFAFKAGFGGGAVCHDTYRLPLAT